MQATEAASVGAPSEADLRLQRILKLVVIALGALLFAGLATVIGRIIYLASMREAQPAALSSASPAMLRMQLPAGAEVRSIALSGDRLAVHYVAGGVAGISVLDLRSGRPLASVGLEPATPAK